MAQHPYAGAGGNGAHHPFKPARPWDRMYKLILADHEFWNQEFEEPANLIRGRINTQKEYSIGEAPVAPDASMS